MIQDNPKVTSAVDCEALKTAIIAYDGEQQKVLKALADKAGLLCQIAPQLGTPIVSCLDRFWAADDVSRSSPMRLFVGDEAYLKIRVFLPRQDKSIHCICRI